MTLSWLVHWNLQLLLVMVAVIHLAPSAPLTNVNQDEASVTTDEDPTIAPLPEPDTEQNVHHRYVADLFRCLQLRDDSKDISSSAHKCVPDVFSTVEDIPFPQLSDTVLNFIATNSKF